MCRVIVDYVTGRGFERNSENQAYSSLRDTNATPCYSRLFLGAKSAPAAFRGRPHGFIYLAARRWPRAARSVAFGQHTGACAGLAARRLQVGVSIELALVEPLQHLAFGDRHPAVPD